MERTYRVFTIPYWSWGKKSRLPSVLGLLTQFHKSCNRETVKLQDPLKRDIYEAGSLEQMQEQQQGRQKIMEKAFCPADW